MAIPTQSLETVAPAFVEMAHRIVWAVAATVETHGAPATRILHPIWEWDGVALTGWIATSPLSPKARHLERVPKISLTYLAPNHDTCTADCDVAWETSDDERSAGWDRFANGPPPVGYDPAIVPAWKSPTSEAFGIIRLDPTRLRVMPGTMMLGGGGQLLVWKSV